MYTSLSKDEIDKLVEHTLPRYDELPSFGVYVDQLITFVNDTVGLYYMPDEKLLTASMVNNYVKQGIVPKPEKKKYSRNHIAYLIVVCVLKKVFSIQETTELIEKQIEVYATEEAYNAFVASLEKSVKRVFSGSGASQKKGSGSFEGSLLVERAVSTFANKVFVQKCLKADED